MSSGPPVKKLRQAKLSFGRSSPGTGGTCDFLSYDLLDLGRLLVFTNLILNYHRPIILIHSVSAPVLDLTRSLVAYCMKQLTESATCAVYKLSWPMMAMYKKPCVPFVD